MRPARRTHLQRLATPVAKDGSYELLAVFTKTRDYGILSFELDGEKIGKPVDIYEPEVTHTKEISLGVAQLSQGMHLLRATAAGRNGASKGPYHAGSHSPRKGPVPSRLVPVELPRFSLTRNSPPTENWSLSARGTTPETEDATTLL